MLRLVTEALAARRVGPGAGAQLSAVLTFDNWRRVPRCMNVRPSPYWSLPAGRAYPVGWSPLRSAVQCPQWMAIFVLLMLAVPAIVELTTAGVVSSINRPSIVQVGRHG